ncbi:MAG: phage holin family protein [Bacteroidota bacterium]
MNIIIRVLVIAAIAYGLANLIPGVHINTYGTAVLVAIVLGLLDFFIKPILILLTLPITFLTLGLFLLVINTLIIILDSKFVHGFKVDGFWPAFWFALALSILSSLIFSTGRREKD